MLCLSGPTVSAWLKLGVGYFSHNGLKVKILDRTFVLVLLIK